MRTLYLHGFASSPQSRKARAFKAALPEIEIPELDSGDFEHLTITGQLEVIERTLRGERARLVGSSMGGYLAALYAASHPEVSRMVLLAPALGFAPRWKEKTSLDVFHHGTGTTRRVHYGLIEDAMRYPPTPEFTQPALIFHGMHDDVVPIANSRVYTAGHANTQLVELDSDHELLNVLARIVAEGVPFLAKSAADSSTGR